jgi:hypothetical protein
LGNKKFILRLKKKVQISHRGRIQAQGKDLEESEAWSQDKPITLQEGVNLLDVLKNKLDVSDRNLRLDAFERCKTFMEHLHSQGGWNVKKAGKPFKKSFPVQGPERVDLEIQSGEAFKT